MLSFRSPRRWILGALSATVMLVGAIFIWSGVARAADQEVVIRSVFVDLETEVIHISGSGFDTKQDTTVILGNFELPIQIESVANIQASLAGTGISPGSYLLEVIVNPGTSRSDEFDLTITDDSAQADEIETLQGQVAALQDQVDALTGLLEGVTRGIDPVTGVETIVFEAMNLQVVNGSGETDFIEPFVTAANGAGNIIIGYNTDTFRTKTGSHNLVIGDAHSYTGTSGIVAGSDNKLTSNFSAIIGAIQSTVSAQAAAVVGGNVNHADGTFSFVGGDSNNRATEDGQAIVGGVSITD